MLSRALIHQSSTPPPHRQGRWVAMAMVASLVVVKVMVIIPLSLPNSCAIGPSSLQITSTSPIV